MIKLADWCKKHGIKYLTGYRWFKDGKMPVHAYQTATGTILVEDPDEEDDVLNMEVAVPNNNLSDSPVSQLIKKAVEISKSGAPVEDLATFVISNFRLEKQEVVEAASQRRAKMKPTKEMTENHFKKFLKSDKQKPAAKIHLFNESELANIVDVSEKASAIEGAVGIEFNIPHNFGTVVPAASSTSYSPQIQSIVSEMNSAMQPLPKKLVATPKTYASVEGGAVFTRSLVDGRAVNNSTLSAATAVPSVSSLSAQASSFEFNSNEVSESVIEDYSPLFVNEVPVYNPVTYDEARALVDLIADSSVKNDSLALDRQAKEICKLGRETFDMMLNSARNKGK